MYITVRKPYFFRFVMTASIVCATLLAVLACAPPPVAAETPAPTATYTPVPTPTQTPALTEPPPPPPFSIAWFSDTQTMVYKRYLREAIPPMFSWVAETKEEYNTICAIHTGDIVENGNNPAYWEAISPLMDDLAQTVPVIAACGNHDVAMSKWDFEPFLKQAFMQRQDPAAQYLGGKAYYQIFDVGGTKLLIVTSGYGCLDEEMYDWLCKTFDAHPDCVGVLAVHSYLSYGYKNTAVYTPPGARMRDNVVAKCKNIRLVLCGHVPGMLRVEETYDDDGDGVKERKVNALRYNYQGIESLKRSGFLRMLKFDPVSRSIEVRTYSPYLDSDCCMKKKKAEEQFVLTDAF